MERLRRDNVPEITQVANAMAFDLPSLTGWFHGSAAVPAMFSPTSPTTSPTGRSHQAQRCGHLCSICKVSIKLPVCDSGLREFPPDSAMVLAVSH